MLLTFKWAYGFLLLFFFNVPFAGFATHIVGGEMNYTCLGNNRYEITLTIFRDCFNGDPNAWFDNPASIGVFDANNRLLEQILVPLMNNDTLNPVLSGECFVVPPSVCVHTTTYRTQVELPFRTGGYQLAYQRCCRNRTILNIINPLASGATYGVTISEQALLRCNSNPKFKRWPPIYICVNEPILFDQSAEDVEGDSIVYSLCAPLLGANQAIPQPQPPNAPPYQSVVWQSPPYGVNNMLNGVAGGVPLRIDAKTGILTGVPNTIGQFVVGICVEEYRNGVLISTTRRDFQYNVGVCGKPDAAFFAPEIQCGDLSVDFVNSSNGARNFLWLFNDPKAPDAFSTEINPTYTFSDSGAYNVMLIVAPGTICADTFVQTIYLQLNTLAPDFEFYFETCTDSLTITAEDFSTDEVATPVSWVWQLQPGDRQFEGRNISFAVDSSGEYTLSLRVQADNACEARIEKSFVAELIEAVLPDTIFICEGDSAALNPDFDPQYLYQWFPAEGLDDPTSPNPVAKIDTNKTYTVTISDVNLFCQIERQVALILADSVGDFTISAEPDTLFGRSQAQLFATFFENHRYSWQPPERLNDPAIFNPIAQPEETTTYLLRIENAFGCIATAEIKLVVIPLACDEPHIFIPTAFTPNGDGENDVFRLRSNTVAALYCIVYNRWGQRVFESRDTNESWDGTFKGQALPPDVYAYYIEAVCFDGTIFKKQGNVSLLK